MKSTQAQAAAMIRKELKKNGISATVKSSSASMMTAVDIHLVDPMPALTKAVKQFVARFQYGSFDGMQDLYEINSWDDSIPQVKYATVNVKFSQELKQAAWDYTRAYWGMEDEPERVDAPKSYRGEQELYRVLSGEIGDFWTSRKPRVRAA